MDHWWGFLPTELSLWFAAKIISPRRPGDVCYAYRCGRFNLIPPANADLCAVADFLESKRRPNHATQLSCRLAGLI